MDERELYERFLVFAELVDAGRAEPVWLPDGDSFCLVEGARITLVEPGEGGRGPVIDVGAAPEHVEACPGALEFDLGGRRVRLDLRSGTLRELGAREAEDAARRRARGVAPGTLAGDPDILEVLDPTRRVALGRSGADLSLRYLVDDRVLPLAAGTDEAPWEVDGAVWSPDGTRVAAMRLDLSGMRRMPVVHWLKSWEEVEWVPYPRSGGPLPQFVPHLVDTRSGRVRPIDIGSEADQLVAFLGFRGALLQLVTINRVRNRIRLLTAGPDGNIDVLYEEERDSFLPAAFGIAVDAVTLLPESGRFIVRSERSGLARLYLYSADGTTCTPLTDGLDLPVAGIDLDYAEDAPETAEQGIVAVDEPGGLVYFKAAARADRPYDRHLYRARLDGSGVDRLTEADGRHDIAFSPSGRFYLDTSSGIDRPPVVSLHEASGAPIAEISRADISRLRELGWRPPEEFTALADDGRTELHGLIYTPADLDPGGSYPVLDMIYAGPQETWVPRRFDPGRGTFAQALSRLGFVCVLVDARGTPGRDKSFHDTVHRRFGRHEIPDHVAALRQAAADRPYMDLGRTGIFGHSWGGYMALRGMLTAPHFFRAGVAAMPVADLDDHHAMAIEPYMSTPQDNPEGYAAASNLELVGELRGRLCVIAGTSDINAPFSATVKLVDALVRAGKRHDLVLLPGVDHHPRGPARGYYNEVVRTFFTECLRPEERTRCE